MAELLSARQERQIPTGKKRLFYSDLSRKIFELRSSFGKWDLQSSWRHGLRAASASQLVTLFTCCQAWLSLLQAKQHSAGLTWSLNSLWIVVLTTLKRCTGERGGIQDARNFRTLEEDQLACDSWLLHLPALWPQQCGTKCPDTRDKLPRVRILTLPLAKLWELDKLLRVPVSSSTTRTKHRIYLKRFDED